MRFEDGLGHDETLGAEDGGNPLQGTRLSRRGVLAGAGGLAAALTVGGSLARQLGVTEAHASDMSGSGVLTLTEGSMIQLTVSPNGDVIMFNLLGLLWTVPASGGTATRVTGLDTDPAYPHWSPRGDRVVFQSYMDGAFNIYSMKPDGSDIQRLTDDGWDYREPVFSPDGTRIAFASDRGGGEYNIFVLDVDSNNIQQITSVPTGSSAYYPAWSPDESELAYVERSGSNAAIRAIAADGSGSARDLYTHSGGTLYSPTWSPSGESIAYVLHDTSGSGRDTQKPLVPWLMVDGERVTDTEDVFTFPAQWLDDDTLVYASDGHIQRRGLSSGTVASIPFTAAISFNRPPYKHQRYDFQGQKDRQVKGIANPVLSPDGTTVAFVALNQLWTMKMGQLPVQLTDDPYYKATPFWSPDGSELAYSSDKDGPEAIYIRDMRSGNERKLTGYFSGAQVRGAWSPDGTKIAFLSATTGSGNAATYMVDVASGSMREILSPIFEPGRPTWGPDSNVVAQAAWRPYSNRYREGQSLILTIDTSTGETEWHNPYPWNSISNRKGDDGPVWSPDGTHMAYVLDGVLWILPVDRNGRPAGDQRQITTENADAVSWSGDSQRLLYLSDGRMRFVPRSGGAPRTVPLKLTWRQDVPTELTVIHAGALWDGENPALRRNCDIIVRGNRIVDVQPHQENRTLGSGVKYVDASDLTVMPGLIEAHGHEQMDQPYVGGRKGRFMLAMGVTSVMGMGDPAYEALEQSESERSGARLTPRYFWAAESIDGERVNYDFMRVTANEESLRRQFERIKALEPNIVKTYVRLRNDWQAAAIQAGHDLGLPSFSHYVFPAMPNGQDCCSHYATQRHGYQLPVSAAQVGYNDTTQLHAASGMGVELTRGHTSLVGTYPGWMTEDRTRKLLNPWQYAAMQGQYNSTLTGAGEATIREFIQTHLRVVRAGGTVLGGTDEPLGLNVWGLQPTIAGFVKWGFTPYEALRTVTALPARALGLEADLGTVKVGKLADLAFVRGNPLEDIRDAAKVEKVMKNGRLHTIADLIDPYAGSESNGG